MYLFPMGVKNKLKVLRVTHGELTQQDLADKVQCSRQSIHSIESEKFVPSVELALKLARVFNVSVNEVFFLEDPRES
jgi:putative transcriptional regulator